MTGACSLPVSETSRTAQVLGEKAPRSLGDLLYPNRARTPASERDWAALVDAIAAGDQLALHALYGRAHRVVFTLALRITNHRETAEEVTLDVFHEVWRRAGQYDAASGTVLGWIMNQARCRAIDRLRFEQRKKRVQAVDDGSATTAVASDPEDALAVRQQALPLRNALSSLTAGEREAIETAFFCELTHTEVAARLNQPLGTIKTRLRSGLAKLRRALSATEQLP